MAFLHPDPIMMILQIGCLVAMLCGVVFIAIGLHQLVRGLGVRKWPTTTARILSKGVDVEAIHGGEEGTTLNYVPRMEFEYQVNGVSHTSHSISRGAPYDAGSRDKAFRNVAHLPDQGGTTKAFYNPRDPAEAVLECGQRAALTKGMSGLPWALAGAVVYYWLFW